MSLTAILAIVILSCDFLLYFFFRYIYSEKPATRTRRAHSRRADFLRYKYRQSQPRTTLSRDNSDQPAHTSFPESPMRLRTGYF